MQYYLALGGFLLGPVLVVVEKLFLRTVGGKLDAYNVSMRLMYIYMGLATGIITTYFAMTFGGSG